MFETAEIGSRLEKAAYREAVPGTRSALLDVQRELATSAAAAVAIVGGSEGAGKEATVSLLMSWMDARGVEVHALWDETDEERDRPRFWRFWRVLPPRGKVAVLFGSWYTQPIIDRAYGRIDEAHFERAMRDIRDFERMLTHEGIAVVKFWLHLAKAEQRKRVAALRADPVTRWRVGKRPVEFFKRYDAFRAASADAIRLTNTGFAPWHIVEALDKRYRNLTVATTLLRALRDAVDDQPKPNPIPDPPAPPVPALTNIINRLDLTRTLAKDAYRRAVTNYQGRLAKLSANLHQAGRSMILVFEGPDAGGKGGAIRRLTEAMDPRLWRVVAIGAPTDEERAHPYLWRFWRGLPRRGNITIYDRSWYGRVLVERLEGLIPHDVWRRAYSEINQFETQLTEFGTLVLKFWMAVSPEEQLSRFRDRQATPYKQYKLTAEDWRNREKWASYEAAACDMIEQTSTDHAPWVLIEADDKYWARIAVLKTVCRHLKSGLGG